MKFQGMLDGLRQSLREIPEHRTGRNTQYRIADAGLGAFSVFYMQSPSLRALTRLDTDVGNTRDRLAAFDQEVATAGEDFVENPVILMALAERLDLGIGPAVEKVRGTVQTIRETALAAQNTVQALNALPFVSIGGSVAEESKLQRLSDGVTNLTEGVQEIRGGVREAKAGATTAVALVLGRGTSRLDAGLASIEATVSGYGAQVSALRRQNHRMWLP
jgi:X-X-X-Leu-X-X-Gly heptad repeat protein